MGSIYLLTIYYLIPGRVWVFARGNGTGGAGIWKTHISGDRHTFFLFHLFGLFILRSWILLCRQESLRWEQLVKRVSVLRFDLFCFFFFFTPSFYTLTPYFRAPGEPRLTTEATSLSADWISFLCFIDRRGAVTYPFSFLVIVRYQPIHSFKRYMLGKWYISARGKNRAMIPRGLGRGTMVARIKKLGRITGCFWCFLFRVRCGAEFPVLFDFPASFVAFRLLS